MQKTSKLSRDGAVWGLLMVAPTIIGLLVLNIWPFIETIYMSFSKSLPFGEFEFEGLDNYIEMFQNPEFWKATGNTILFCILTVPVGIFLALLVAVLLNSKIRGRTTFRAIFFLPMVVAPAAVAMVWKWMFNTEYGIINTLLGHSVNWITDPNIVMITCAIVAIWSSIGYDAGGFGYVEITYDEDKAQAAATEHYTDENGKNYPLLAFSFPYPATQADGSQVKGSFTDNYYLDE